MDILKCFTEIKTDISMTFKRVLANNQITNPPNLVLY